MPTITEALAQAVTHHRAGELSRAEQLYRQILEADPQLAEAWHLLGMVAHSTGQSRIAVEFINRAIQLKSQVPAFHNNIGLVLQGLKDLPRAAASYQRALELQPDYAIAHNNLGNVCKEQGRLSEAAACYRNALELKPDFAEAHNNLGIICKEQQDLDAAVLCYRRALELKPEFIEAHNNLGNVLRDAGQSEEAEACYRRCLELKPEFAEAYFSLGRLLRDRGEYAGAESCLLKALGIKPDFPDAEHELGMVLQQQERHEEACVHYRRVLIRQPGFADAHLHLGMALEQLGQMTEAVVCFRRNVDLRSDSAEGHFHLGNALRRQGLLNDALDCYERALDRRPEYAEARINLGTTYQDLGRVDEAVCCYQQVLQTEPAYAEALSNLGVALLSQGLPEEALEQFQRAASAKPAWPQPRNHIAFALNFCPTYDARAMGDAVRQWVTPLTATTPELPGLSTSAPTPHRRLRIGYLSPHFRHHCQAHFTVPLFAAHQHQDFEIVCYADVATPDDITARLRSYADVWHSVAGSNDAQIAERIRQDQIDILVDLTMHMAGTRWGVFARRPAPVQVCWLAYPGTTGLPAIDFRLTDPYLDPPGRFDDCYTESSMRLPDSFWCYAPLTNEPQVNALPADSHGFITFGSLNNFCKVNEQVLRLWGEVLRTVTDSRLLLLAPEGTARARVCQRFAGVGVAADRIMFVSRMGRREYLEQYHRIDIGLDTLPANGHTTSLDAYWMGVPVATIVGPTAVGRAGVSQLTNLGLTDLIAETPEQFVQHAVSLAADLPRLRELRATLRTRMESSPLMDRERFARHMEAAYRDMWQARGPR